MCICIWPAGWDSDLRADRNDAKTVSIIEFACFHPVIKVQSASLHFFLGSDDEKPDSDEEDNDVSLITDRRVSIA